MNLWDQLYRRYLIHIFVVLVFLVYLVSANHIFCCLLTVDREAHIHNIDIPAETDDIKYYVDAIEKHQIDWKNIMLVRGWSFIEGEDARNCSTYVMIKTDTKEFVFDTGMETRPDVTQYFKAMQLNLDESGFRSYIPLEHIPDGTHQIGVIVVKGNKMAYILTNTYAVKEGETVGMERR
jgi:hypothetical protein